MAGTSEGAKKAAKTLLEENPNYFSELSKRSKKPKGGKYSPGSFKKGDRFKRLGRRGKIIRVTSPIDTKELEDFGMGPDFIETPIKKYSQKP